MDKPQRKKMELKKHVNTIHCSNALTLVERQVYNALLYHAYDDLLVKREHEIPIAHLKELIGYGSRDYRKLKSYLKGLMGKVLEWNVIGGPEDNNSESWVGSTILASAEIKNNVCTYQYSDKMSQLLYRPDIYGRLDLTHISKFRSKFGLALYENCMRYQNISNTSWMSIDVFRKLMGVFEGKFTRFSDLKKYVIDVAVNEVNTIAPISIVPQYKKQGRAVVQIKFDIAKASSPLLEQEQKGRGVDSPVVKVLLSQFNFSRDYINDLCKKYSEEYIQEKLDTVLNSTPYKKGEIRSLSGYLVEALEKNYQPNTNSISHKINQREIKVSREKEVSKQEEQFSRAYKEYVDSAVNDYLSGLSSSKHDCLLSNFKEFIEHANNPVLERYFSSHGLDHAITGSAFKKFVSDVAKSEGHVIKNFSDFKENCKYVTQELFVEDFE